MADTAPMFDDIEGSADAPATAPSFDAIEDVNGVQVDSPPQASAQNQPQSPATEYAPVDFAQQLNAPAEVEPALLPDPNKGLFEDANRIRSIFSGPTAPTTEDGVDKHSQILQLRQRTGLSYQTIAEKLPEFQKQWELAQTDPVEWVRHNPQLADYVLRNPEAGTMVPYDPGLDKVSKALNAITGFIFPSAADVEAVRRATTYTDPFTGKKSVPGAGSAVDAAATSESVHIKEPQAGLARQDEKSKAINESTFGGALAVGQREKEAVAGINANLTWWEIGKRRHAPGEPKPTALLEQQALDFESNAQPRDLQQGEVGKVLSSAASGAASSIMATGDMLKGATGGALITGTIGAGITLLGTRSPALARAAFLESAGVGAKLGGKGGAYAFTVRAEGGAYYRELLQAKRDDGSAVPEDEAWAGAMIVGNLNAAIEVGTINPSLAVWGGVGELIKSGSRKAAVAELLRNGAFRNASKRLAKQWAEATLTESGEETLQNLTKQAASYFLGTQKEVSLAEGVKEGLEAVPSSALLATTGAASQHIQSSAFQAVTGVGGAVTDEMRARAGLEVSQHLQRSDDAHQSAAIVHELANFDVHDSPVTKADPEGIAQALQSGGLGPSLYITTDAYVKFNQGAKVDLETAAKRDLGPDGYQRLKEAVATGQPLEVPSAKYLADWSTEQKQALEPHTTTRADLPTPAAVDKKEFDGKVQALLDAMEKGPVEPETPGEAAFLDVAEAQLEMSSNDGDPQKARQKMELMRATVRVYSEVFGQSADELFKNFALHVSAGLDPTMEEVLQARNEKLSATDRAEELLRDEGTGLPNEAAMAATRAPEGKPLVGHLAVEGFKWLNDQVGHDKADLLARAVGVALSGVAQPFKLGGANFGFYVKDQAELDSIAEKVRAAMPAQLRGFDITAAVGKTVGEASALNQTNIDQAVKEGARANTRPPHPTLPGESAKAERPKGLPADLAPESLAFPENKASGVIAPEAVESVTKLTPEDYFKRAYRDPVTGEWTERAWKAMRRKAHVAMIDVAGLGNVNAALGKAGGNEMLRRVGFEAQSIDGHRVDFTHLHGDEYCAQSDDPVELEGFLDQLRANLSTQPLVYTDPKTGKLKAQPIALHTGLGERTLEAADADLNAKKAAARRARETGLVRRGSEHAGSGRAAGSEAGGAARAESGSGRSHEEKPGGVPEALRGAPGDSGVRDRLSVEEQQLDFLKSKAANARAPEAKKAWREMLAWAEGDRKGEFPSVPWRFESAAWAAVGFGDPKGFAGNEAGTDLRKAMGGRGRVNNARNKDIGLSGNARDMADQRKRVPGSQGFFQEPNETTLFYDMSPEPQRFEQSNKQTETPAFKKWFGASKVVDESGQPQVVFHGSAYTGAPGAEAFSETLQDKTALFGPGFYFTVNPDVASTYVDKEATAIGKKGETPGVVPAYLSISTPFDVDAHASALVPQLKKFRAKTPPATIKRMIDSALKDETGIGSADGVGTWIDNTEWAYRIADGMKKTGDEIARPHFDYILSKARDYIVKGITSGEFETGEDVIKHIEHNVFEVMQDHAGNVRQVLEMLGFDGITHTGGGRLGGGDKMHKVWIAFKPTQIKSALGNKGTFDPNNPSILESAGKNKGEGPRGHTEIFNEGLRRVYNVVLNPKADLSTFLHESAHVFLDLMSNLALRPDAPDRVRTDFAAALKYLGAKNAEDLKLTTGKEDDPARLRHEKWATAFERYLFEGKAPSVKLEGAFARYRLWLSRVYGRVEAAVPGAHINDDIRRVFDRMLATDAEIDEQKKRMGHVAPMAANVLGLTPEQFKAHIEAGIEATSHTRKRVDMAVAKDVLREKEAWWKEELRAEREKAKGDYEQLQARQVQQALANKGDIKTGPLDKAKVVAAIGAPAAKKLGAAATKTGGADPGPIAEFFGFKTVEEMLKALLELKPKNEWVNETADQRMAEKHPELLAERTKLQQMVDAGLHGELDAKYLERELMLLSAKMTVPGQPLHAAQVAPIETAKAAAKQSVETRSVRKLDANAALEAERRAATAALKAGAAGNVAKAFNLYLQRMTNFYAWKGLLAAREMRDAFLDLAGELGSQKGMSRLGKGSPVYRDQVAAALGELGLGEETGEPFSPDAVVTQMRADTDAGRTVVESIDPEVLRSIFAKVARYGRGRPKGLQYTVLTVAELRHVKDMLESIKAAAKNVSTAVVDGKRIELQEAVDLTKAAIERSLPPLPPRPERGAGGPSDELSTFGSSLDAMQLRIETMLLHWFGGVENYAWKAIGKPLQQAKHVEVDLLRGPVKQLLDAANKIPFAVLKRGSELIDGNALFPGSTAVMNSIGLDNLNRRWQFVELLKHMGNESNKKKLLEGRNITEQQVWDAALKLGITKEEYDYVQATWDAAESLKKAAFDLEEKDTGIRPEEVVASPFSTPFGQYRGGYHPIAYHPATQVGQRNELSLTPQGYASVGTSNGSLISRVEDFTNVVSLDPYQIQRHLLMTVHDIAFRQPLRSVALVVRSKPVHAALVARVGEARTRAIEKYLEDIGQQRSVEEPKVLYATMQALRGVMSVSVLGYSFANALEDAVTGVVGAMPGGKIQPQHWAAGMKEVMGSPVDKVNQYEAESGELRSRHKSLTRELSSATAKWTSTLPAAAKVATSYVKDHAFVMQEATDRMVSAGVYAAAKRQALAQYELAPTDAQVALAIEEAEATVRLLMPSGHVVDSSMLMRNKGLAASMFIFFRFWNTQYNVSRTLTGRDVFAGKDFKALATMGGLLFANVFAYSILGSLARGQGPDKGEGWAMWFARKMTTGSMAQLPVFGELSEYVWWKVFGGNKHEPRNNSIAGMTWAIAELIAKASNGDATADQRLLALAKLGGLTTGVVPNQLIKSASYLLGLQSGEFHPRGPGDIVGGVLYGQNKHPASNLATIAQDLASGEPLGTGPR
jgi:GGDEF domain-containing protein